MKKMIFAIAQNDYYKTRGTSFWSLREWVMNYEVLMDWPPMVIEELYLEITMR